MSRTFFIAIAGDQGQVSLYNFLQGRTLRSVENIELKGPRFTVGLLACWIPYL